MTTVVDCLGRSRPVERTWPDGEFECPFCRYPSNVKGCPNPACSAGARCFDENGVPHLYVVDAFREQIERAEAEEARKQRDAESRASVARTYELAAQERRERLAVDLAEAEARKACVVCVRFAHMHYRTVKFVKHRGLCPRQ